MSATNVSAALIQEIKATIIKSLRLDLAESEIGDDEPLFVEGLGLDSVDAIEIVVGLETHFHIQLKNDQFTRDDFYSVTTLAALVQRIQAKNE
jgi:acyl carrier protein